MISILKRGLLIAPPEAPRCGAMFGDVSVLLSVLNRCPCSEANQVPEHTLQDCSMIFQLGIQTIISIV
jgi:hypothetical protein